MIKHPLKYALGQSEVKSFPKTQQTKIVEMIDEINDLQDSVTNGELDEINPPSGTLTINATEVITSTDLTVGGGLEVDGPTSIVGLFFLSGTPQTLTGAGAVNLTTKVTLLVTTAANALTLAAGAEGQVKIIKMKTDGGDGTLTVTGASGFTTITFSAVGQTATLLYKDTSWNVLSTFGAVVA